MECTSQSVIDEVMEKQCRLFEELKRRYPNINLLELIQNTDFAKELREEETQAILAHRQTLSEHFVATPGETLDDFMVQLHNSSRMTGKWLVNVGTCIDPARPCGNPICADEAMRSGEIGAIDKNSPSSIYAFEHAQKIARRCIASVCPLDILAPDKTRYDILLLLKTIHEN